MKKPKPAVSIWTTIYFFFGEEVRSQEVLTKDLPRLSGGATFWRESMTDEERAKIMRSRAGAYFESNRDTKTQPAAKGDVKVDIVVKRDGCLHEFHSHYGQILICHKCGREGP